MSKEKICGIYCIENKVNGKKYIGQSVDINKRWYEHKRKLNKNEHYNKYLQRSWSKYCEKDFVFYIVEECSINKLNKKEFYYIGEYNTNESLYGYNMNAGGDHIGCWKHSKETKRKISEIQTGRKLSNEWKKAISDANKGKTPKNFTILEEIREKSKLKVMQYDVHGNLVKVHESVNDCARDIGGYATNAVKTLKGRNKTFKTFILIYEKDYTDELLQERLKKITSKMMSRYNICGKFN